MSNVFLGKINPPHKLLEFKLIWHGKVMKDILIKYKLFIILLLLLLAPTFHSMINIISLPAKAIIGKEATISTYFFSILGYQVIALIWFYLQSPAFMNQPWKDYIDSLPLNKNKLMYVDVGLLTITNFMIWLPLFIASYMAIKENVFSFVGALTLIERLLCAILLTTGLQIVCMRNSLLSVNYILILNVILLLNFNFTNFVIQNIFFILYVLISYQLIQSCYNNPSLIKYISFFKRSSKNSKSEFHIINCPIARVEASQLIKDSAIQFIQSAIIIQVIFFLAFIFSKYGSENKNFYFCISCLTLLGSLSLSNLFSRLHIQRELYLDYLRSLPLSRWKLFYANYAFVWSLQLLFLIVLYSIVFLSVHLNISFLILEFLITSIFLASTYYPQVTYKRYGMIISLLATAFFLSVNYFLIKSI